VAILADRELVAATSLDASTSSRNRVIRRPS
jgi:hypothetical protein